MAAHPRTLHSCQYRLSPSICTRPFTLPGPCTLLCLHACTNLYVALFHFSPNFPPPPLLGTPRRKKFLPTLLLNKVPPLPPLLLSIQQGIANMLADELGYEDQEEFEDALKASFKDFIGALPHIEARGPSQKHHFTLSLCLIFWVFLSHPTRTHLRVRVRDTHRVNEDVMYVM